MIVLCAARRRGSWGNHGFPHDKTTEGPESGPSARGGEGEVSNVLR